MLKLQNLVITLHNKSQIEVFLVEQPPMKFRSLVTLPTSALQLLSWHEQTRPHASATEAFRWAIRHVDHFCKRVGTTIDEIDSPGEADFISSSDQLQIIAAENIAASVSTNGVLASS